MNNYLNYSIGLSHQSRLDCAVETGYPSCLIQQYAGDNLCEVMPSPQVSNLYQKCLQRKGIEMEANMCPPGETHDGYGNCIPTTNRGQNCKPGYWNPTDAGCSLRPGCERYIEPNCVSSHTYRCKNTVICDGKDVKNNPLQEITFDNGVPQERTPLQEVGDWFTARQEEIAREITYKPNPPCRQREERKECEQDWKVQFNKSKDIVKWVAIGLVAIYIINR